MIIKKVGKKLAIAKNVLFKEGLLAFVIRGLTFVQKKVGKKPESPKHKIYTKTSKNSVLRADFIYDKKNWSVNNKIKDSYHFAWIMPPPGKGSGGHMNIFRFIQALENAGHKCCVILDLDNTSGTTSHIKAVMEGYPVTEAENNMQWLYDIKKQDLNKYDGIFATSWETAYSSYGLPTNVERFYFVQDFEPYFYPVGSLYYLAENTYKFGFFGITAGKWLAKKLGEEYSMDVDSYDFASEKSIYKITNKKPRKSILFYARPYTERRGFEMGVLALEIFHAKHPDYKILFAGWDTSNYDIPFPYENLKTLEIEELNNIYNQCIAGLILSYTNMSLLPLEIMASGAIPVVNDAPNNRLVSNNKFIAYSENSPHALAAKLSEVVTRKNSVSYSESAAESVRINSWEDSQIKFEKIVSSRMSKK